MDEDFRQLRLAWDEIKDEILKVEFLQFLQYSTH